MCRFLLFLFTLLFLSCVGSPPAMEESSSSRVGVYHFTPLTYDLIANWGEPAEFPFDKYWHRLDGSMAALQGKLMAGYSYTYQTQRQKKQKIAIFLKALDFEIEDLEIKNHEFSLILSQAQGDRLAGIIKHLNSLASEFSFDHLRSKDISAKVEILALPLKVIADYGFGLTNQLPHRMTNEDYAGLRKKLLKEPGVYLLAQGGNSTPNGNTAKIRDVREVYFPVDFEFVENELFMLNSEGSSHKLFRKEVIGAKGVYEEPLDLGLVWTWTPSFNNDLGGVEFKLEYIDFLGSVEYGEKDFLIEMPLLRNLILETELVVEKGETSLISLQYAADLPAMAQRLLTKQERSPGEEMCYLSYLSVEGKRNRVEPNDWQILMMPLGGRARKKIKALFKSGQDQSAGVKKILISMGVEFPAGSQFFYEQEIGVVRVWNKTAELKLIKEILKMTPGDSFDQNLEPAWMRDDEPEIRKNILTSSFLLELSPAVMKKFSVFLNKDISLNELRALMAGLDDESKLMSISSVITMPGNTVLSSNGLWCAFPEEYDFATAKNGESVALPILGELRELGSLSSITPELDEDDVNASIMPEFVDFVGWGKDKMPMIAKNTLESELKLPINQARIIDLSSVRKGFYDRGQSPTRVKIMVFHLVELQADETAR